MGPIGVDPNPLIALLRECVVRIDDGSGSFLGSGFFVAPGVVLACAHVVHGATGLRVAWGEDETEATVIEAVPPLALVSDPRTYPLPDLVTIDVGDAFAAHPCVRLARGRRSASPSTSPGSRRSTRRPMWR
ncbi:MAG: hypothetical protein ACR2KK_17150 [Acidimicrobiales bacterium]